jgi:hypothetical protein
MRLKPFEIMSFKKSNAFSILLVLRGPSIRMVGVIASDPGPLEILSFIKLFVISISPCTYITAKPAYFRKVKFQRLYIQA